MVRKTVSVAIALLSFGVCSAVQADIAYETASRQIVEAHILPGYAAFAEAGRGLEDKTRAYCVDGSGGLADVKDALQEAMAAWQSVQHIRFGPIAEEDRHFRLEFWPDKRNKTSKALAMLRRDIAEGETVDADRMARTSVAAQGFPALERLVYNDDKMLESGGVDCRLATLISANIASIGQKTLSAWTDGGFAKQVLNADGYYQKPKDLAFELFKTFQTSLQWIEDTKLRRPMGDDIDSARGRRAESWRSEASIDHLLRNIAATKAFYTANDEGGFAALLQVSQLGGDLHWGIVGKMREAQEALQKLDLPLHKAVKDPANRKHLENAVAALRELRRWVDADMAALLDMPLGFNSLDGD